MRMLVSCLVGGAVCGFLTDKLLAPQMAKLTFLSDPAMKSVVIMSVGAFLGALWGWVGRSICPTKVVKKPS